MNTNHSMTAGHTRWWSLFCVRIDVQQGWIAFNKESFGIPLYPSLILLLHTLLFAVIFPRLDLPVADGANYFGYGKLYARHGSPLYADWTPLLTYLVAAAHWLLPINWYYLFGLYSWVCQFCFLIGVYLFIASATRDNRWAFLNTILVAICFTYWIQISGRAFANGALLVLLAIMLNSKRFTLASLVGSVGFSLLLRFEHAIVTTGIGIVRCLRNRASAPSDAWWRFTPGWSVFLVITLFFWIPIFQNGVLTTGRLEFAFAQKFRDYMLYEHADSPDLQVSRDWNIVLETYFPPERRSQSVFLNTLIPLYEVASANPGLFARFVWHNCESFLTAKFRFIQSTTLSNTIHLYIYGCLLAAGWRLWQTHQTDRLYWAAAISVVMLLSLVPCLVTRPIRDYIMAAVIWFFCVIPSFALQSPRTRTMVISAWLVIAGFIQLPFWTDILRQQQPYPNWKRADLVQQVSHSVPLDGKTIAEAYPVFSAAFHDMSLRPVHYSIRFDSLGTFYAYQNTRIPIDLVLLEERAPDHLRAVSKTLQHLLPVLGTLLARENRYSLWSTEFSLTAPEKTMQIRSLRTPKSHGGDEVSYELYGILLYWNHYEPDCVEYHIYVSRDGSFEYLGKTPNAGHQHYIWLDSMEQNHEMNSNESHRVEPQAGQTYRFRVYGIPSDRSRRPDYLESEPFVYR